MKTAPAFLTAVIGSKGGTVIGGSHESQAEVNSRRSFEQSGSHAWNGALPEQGPSGEMYFFAAHVFADAYTAEICRPQ